MLSGPGGGGQRERERERERERDGERWERQIAKREEEGSGGGFLPSFAGLPPFLPSLPPPICVGLGPPSLFSVVWSEKPEQETTGRKKEGEGKAKMGGGRGGGGRRERLF